MWVFYFIFFNLAINSYFLKNTTQYFCGSDPDHRLLFCILCYGLSPSFYNEEKTFKEIKYHFQRQLDLRLSHLIWSLFKKYLSVVLLWVNGYFQNHSGLFSPAFLHPVFVQRLDPQKGPTPHWSLQASAEPCQLLLFEQGIWSLLFPGKIHVLEAMNWVHSFSVKLTPPLSTKQINK